MIMVSPAESPQRRLMPWLTLALAVLAGALVLVAGPMYRVDWVGLGIAFDMLRTGAWLAVLGTLLALAVLFAGWGGRRGRALAILSLALALPAAWLPYDLRQQAASVPPIHDVSTDTEDPPRFVAIAEIRPPGSNSIEYAGEDVARQQARAYPDIQPMMLPVAPARAFDAALMVMRELGWDVVDIDADSGRVEATATTYWFGFKDDVVVRVRPAPAGSRVDIRSASRIGVSDLGKNAQRIREFLRRLPDAVDRVASPVGDEP
jgi:uncharacterized protein (DUF1499 family)